MADGGWAELEARLRAEGLDPGSWGNGPVDRYGVHRHAYDKVIVVVHGSITFGASVPDGSARPIGLGAGDRLELPAGTDHDATVGPAGVSCLEAHMPAGTLGTARRVPAGDW